MNQEEKLEGNIKIEDAIADLQKVPSQEMLAHTLTVIRRRMKEDGHLIVAIDPTKVLDNLQMQVVTSEDGKKWFAAFTSFEEELKGSNSVMSAFTSPISKVLEMSLQASDVEGLILNPWNRTIMLDKNLIQIIFGKE